MCASQGIPETQEQGVKYTWRDPRPDPVLPDLAARKWRDAVGRHAACSRPDGPRNGPWALPQAENATLRVENSTAA
ncbi:hypothetical protein NDU88_001801 [Pleurodeles waltl]|uniref:Uncharacterized protein n=1 Tax=Pleurodeles waltl TaxID=8319 RepID=A0AAV7R855_PLEWA|nr:hypothetical protein NDU88_001801 [Pleurodeles waltl]